MTIKPEVLAAMENFDITWCGNLADAIDAAIDAMHNSTREVGE